MSALPGPANPVFYAQFYLRGGWKNTLLVAGEYGAIVGGTVWLTAAAAENHSSSVLSGWTSGLLVIQALLLLLYGGFRVSSSVRADVTGKIIESHRLMPVAPSSAVIGYVTGALAQAVALAIVNFILGLITSAVSSGDVQRWIIANLMLGALSLVIWMISAQIAFAARGGFVLLLILMLVSISGGGETLTLLPGLNVLTCPLVSRSVLDTRASLSDLPFCYGAALIGQFLIGAISFVACTRKYRSSEAIGLTDSLGLLLLAAWVLISAVGIGFASDFETRFFRSYRSEDDFLVTQFVATMVTAMLLAIIPLSSAARIITAWRRTGGPTPSQPRRPLPMILIPLAATFIICVLLLIHPKISIAPSMTVAPTTRNLSYLNPSFPLDMSSTPILFASCQSILVVAAFLVSMSFLYRWVYLAVSRAWLIAVIWLVITWIIPLVVDLAYRGATNSSDSMGAISAISPIGALAMIWSQNPTSVLPGMAIQWGLTLIPAFLLFSSKGRRQKPAPILAT